MLKAGLIMNEHIVQLRDRLNDLSGRNRAIRLVKMYHKHTVDLMDLQSIQGDDAIERILNNLYKNRKSFQLMRTMRDTEENRKVGHRLQTLYRTLKHLEDETGRYDLFVGYPFISGTLRDGSFIQAPLCLYPIRLIQKNRNLMHWTLEKIDNGKPILNRTLFLALQKYHQFELGEIFSSELPNQFQGLSLWKDWLLGHGLESIIRDDSFQHMVTYTQETQPEQAPLTLHSFAVMGNFPQGNSAIAHDYEQLLLSDDLQNVPLVQELLQTEKERVATTGIDQSAVQSFTRPKEQDQFYLYETDGSQESILQKMRHSSALVVDGPPGTGKSQVIANMITDAMAAGKKVLVVCQKRAALDVVYQRLDEQSLTSHVALLHDEKLDRKQLYQKMNTQITEEAYLVSKQQSRYQKLCAKIEERVQTLNELCQGLHEVQSFGFTAYQLYARTKSLKNQSFLIPREKLDLQIHQEDLAEMVGTISTYAEFVDKYKHNAYELIERKSLAKAKQSTLIQWSEQLKWLAHELAEMQENLQLLDHTRLTPAYMSVYKRQLHEIAGDLHTDNPGFLQRIRLGWWTRFSGKELLTTLMQGKRFRGVSSADWSHVRKQLLQMVQIMDNMDRCKARFQVISKLFRDGKAREFQGLLVKGELSSEAILNIHQTLIRDFDTLQTMDQLWEQATPTVKAIITHLESQQLESTRDTLKAQWVEALQQSHYLNWIEQIEEKHPSLRMVSDGQFNHVRKELAQLLEQKKPLVQTILRDRIHEQINKNMENHTTDLKKLRHQTGKQRQIWPVRKCIEHFADTGLMAILPVWLTTPEMVSAVFPLQRELFDLVIFDEASQCTVESAIPAIYRASRLVIAGDEKQLPPMDLFRNSLYAEEDESEELDNDVTQAHSLLDLAKGKLSIESLLYHYRSQAEELINFSNHAFYDGSIQVVPNVDIKAKEPAISWNKVEGRWINRCNEIEGVRVIELLKKHLRQQPQDSLGIITFNVTQQDKIEQLIDRELQSDSEFLALYEQAMSQDLDKRIFVKNIENVQGDERDTILFSVGYAKDKDGRVYNRFGSLNKKGGENRLNVAITRAKKRIVVVSSVDSQELNVTGSSNEGPKLLKQYLAYAQAVHEQDHEQVRHILQKVNHSTHVVRQYADDRFESPFEAEVCERLRERGYRVETQIGVSKYRIDLGIVHPHEKNQYLLGIECDGAMYHSSPEAKERDLYRQRFLEGRGWTILRIWSRNWWKNPVAEIDRIDEHIKQMLANERYSEMANL